MKDFINLGKPSGNAMSEILIEKEKSDEMFYPSLSIRGKNEIYFPEEGEAIIKYKKCASGSSEYRGRDPEYYCDLEVIAIKPMGSSSSIPPKLKNAPDFEESLKKAASKGKEDDDYEDS
jgi:hypothetical protein